MASMASMELNGYLFAATEVKPGIFILLIIPPDDELYTQVFETAQEALDAMSEAYERLKVYLRMEKAQWN